MRKIFLTIALCLALLPLLALDRPRILLEIGSSGDLVAAVNSLRSSYGLPALKINQAITASAQATAAPGTPQPTPLPIFAVATVTPRADGSIVHRVQPGQTVITIAEAYGVKAQDILNYNGLTDKSVIFPGDFLLIKLPATPNGSETPTIGGTPTTGGTPKRPTQTRSPTPVAAISRAAPEASSAVTPAAAQPQSQAPAEAGVARPDYLLVVISALGLLGAALVVLGNILKRVD